MKRLFLGVSACLCLVLAAACGGDGDDGSAEPESDITPTATSATEEGPGGDDGDEDGDSPSGDMDLGRCDLTVTGDVTLSGSAGGGASAFGSDYYYTDDEMREILRAFAGFGSDDASDDELDALVEEAMAEDPRLYILIINCVSEPDFSLSILPSGQATYADIPFGEGTYGIPAGGPLGGQTAANEFALLLTLEGDDIYQVSEPGELAISRWDEEGIAGTFSFSAVESFAEGGEPNSVSVEGAFEFACTDGSRCER
jgi:hypothetical protein